MKRALGYLPLLLLLSVPWAAAQGPFNVAIGFGSMHDPSNGLGIDNASSANAFGPCTVSSQDPFCEPTPSLGRLFMGFAGEGMFDKHFGIGGELTFQPTKGNYAPLQYREIFYDFDGVYAPINNKRVALLVEGGIGGAHTGFSFSQTSCVGIAVCSTSNLPVGTSNHFQQHAGVGVQVYLTEHFFIRPQFDYYHVDGFTQQFGKDTVIGSMVWFGYNFGEP